MRTDSKVTSLFSSGHPRHFVNCLTACEGVRPLHDWGCAPVHYLHECDSTHLLPRTPSIPTLASLCSRVKKCTTLTSCAGAGADGAGACTEGLGLRAGTGCGPGAGMCSACTVGDCPRGFAGGSAGPGQCPSLC